MTRAAEKGLRDKLYWRAGINAGAVFHCYTKNIGRGYRSLCGALRVMKIGGRASQRPEPVLRCARCDGLEAERRGWDESGPTLLPRIGTS